MDDLFASVFPTAVDTVFVTLFPTTVKMAISKYISRFALVDSLNSYCSDGGGLAFGALSVLRTCIS